MKQILLSLVIIICVTIVPAQNSTVSPPVPATAQDSVSNSAGKAVEKKENDIFENSSNNKENAKPDKTSKKRLAANSRFNLPPEKLAPLRVTRFETGPIIDGKIDDAAWKQAAVFKDFYQTSPGDNIEPSKPTVAMIGYDAENLYFGFHCFDEPGKIRATVARRDGVLGEDNVRIYLDTFNDQRRAFVMMFNPLGIQQDGLFTEGEGDDYSFDIVMESKGAIVADGWTLEVRIPFKSLRYAAGKNKLWGIHVQRNIDRFNDEIDSWMPVDRNVTGFLIQEGKINGLENIKVERTLELVPSITLSQTGERIEEAALSSGQRFLQRGLRRDVGLTAKFVITPNITLDAAFNPDFAEVEADAPAITANQRFPLFFPELRPFFLEGIDIFQSPLNIVYTRTIQNPDVATKLTGKIGRNVFGVLAASDRVFGSEDNALVGVARVRRDVGLQSNLGVFLTGRQFGERRNAVGGFDGRLVLTPKLVFNFQAVGSNTRGRFYNPNTDQTDFRSGNGVAYSWNLDYTERDRGWFIEGDGASRDYRTDVGFNRRTNTNRIFYATRLSTAPKPKAPIIRASWNTFGEINFNWQGRSQQSFLGSGINFSLQRNTNINIESGSSYERLFEDEFGARRNANQIGAFAGGPERSAYQPYVGTSVRSQPSQRITFSGRFGLDWNLFDFDFGAGNRFFRVSPAYLAYLERLKTNPNESEPLLDPGPGRSLSARATVELRPINPFRFSLDYTKSKLVRNDTRRTAFDTNIFTVRSTYQFTRFTFVRARWDYYTIDGNVRGQLLYGWNPNPGTALYVGYNDNFNYNGFNPFTNRNEPGFERNSRTFFVRATYLFRRSF